MRGRGQAEGRGCVCVGGVEGLLLVAVVVGGGSMASTISLIDRVSRRGLFFNKAPLRGREKNQ